MSGAFRRRVAVAAAVLITASQATALTAAALPSTEVAKTPAVISLGDSYISGEAGRWRGNALENSGDKWGTDLATKCDGSGCTTDPQRVYGDTHDGANMCHRSTSAEIVSAAIPDVTAINLACSGATTADVRDGDPARNQPDQVELLRAAVRDHQVKLVVLSIGGNDLGFGDIIADCAKGYLSSYRCAPKWDSTIAGQLDQLRADVGATIKAIKEVVNAAQGTGTYQFVLQSYPAPMPAAAGFRIPESGPRWSQGGCPVWNSDADWARKQLVPTIADQLAQVAANRGVRFLDLRDAFDGREVCASGSRQATDANSAANPLPGTEAEWVRWVVTGYSAQGDRQESMHPNHYGQRALGTCLRLMHQKATGNHACHNTPDAGPGRMTLTAINRSPDL
ncbi:GDSL-type esterase/lipase family protein [Saccharothrix sp. S26]|uniref:GDSL-type esterase/lipase family protein n=1 Tax=Saccharothrix sp. S26 TaxID=2907215 RepID=UPI001F360846|nr:GDSL-type esterase/lipase family protein [Saccharothrix sp. S26]MCE6998622.1 GDSL-type esterase/lipase family protein [Saccharothrix sp. S26]